MTQKDYIKKREKEIAQHEKRMRERNDKFLKSHKLIFHAIVNNETGWYDYEQIPYIDTTKMPYDLATMYYPTETTAINEVRRLNLSIWMPEKLLQVIFGGTLEDIPEYTHRYTKKRIKTGKDESKQKGNM